MQRAFGETWEVMRKNGNGGLCMWYYTSNDSQEGARYAIDEANRRAVEDGYSAEQFLIVHHEWMRLFNDNGVFLSSEETKTAVEMYPDTI